MLANAALPIGIVFPNVHAGFSLTDLCAVFRGKDPSDSFPMAAICANLSNTVFFESIEYDCFAYAKVQCNLSH